ncbi:MAG: hypothetical protein CO186_09645 [Zetaproteobacteria bacterium CG_4_9_14_3_um_filter_49_83]|nr:MAG: hypothetical protein COW62_07795 [Zetaproteobacteria bacterium CG17_big_fil_post_rev_8_21_14_2_50_50_13]PIV30616.1 MAG: hypothetical protein COS35_05805 [Zetaproteobacteria bacterium CG02_land_8_20_14_3_00_50_9]PIY56965.1 MAG: hypothetical protein COZ00_01210 [Zetaproteobacteria bacterium CG_4_10_14_0_8_um_filter_49_80]PJA34632.1 MAG: hypothetical protein CO186_09645 [Zetaproteobacteria bacterium CG_4_9_14_3_um_filter_49_83]
MHYWDIGFKVNRILITLFLLIIFTFGIKTTNEYELNATMDRILNDNLYLHYEKIIAKKYNDIFGKDFSGSWWVQLQDSSMRKISKSYEDVIFENEEAQREKSYIKKIFHYNDSLDEYKLYKFDMIIEDNSVCQNDFPCSVYILKRAV